MITIRNMRECKDCPVAWLCCQDQNPCPDFDKAMKRCRIYATRPNSCRSSYCEHMKIYTDGTLQDILIREKTLLAEHRCETCGSAPEDIVIDDGVAHYHCKRCTSA